MAAVKKTLAFSEGNGPYRLTIPMSSARHIIIKDKGYGTTVNRERKGRQRKVDSQRCTVAG